MEYGADVLRKDSAFYTLDKATFSNGILYLRAGGSATTSLTTTELAKLTEWFRLTYIGAKFANNYLPEIRIVVQAQLVSGERFTITGYPVNNSNGVYQQEFQIKAGEYSICTYTIESDVDVAVSLWELCPTANEIDPQTIIDGVSQALPRLLFDYNTSPLIVSRQEATVGVITCRLLADTDLQGHFAITFQASEVSTITIRFYDNEGEELFAPLFYDSNIGHNTIGIPHSYLRRKSGIHSFVVTMQTNAGHLTIGTRNMLFTIDGGYLAQRVLDVAMDVMDLAIRQISSSNGPDEIWIVGNDAGKTLVRKRDYNEENVNVTWTAVAAMGYFKAGAIEFNGQWVLRAAAGKYTLNTEEVPYLFLVTEEGQLWAYHGPNDEVPFLLDTSVTMVRACRGFSSIDYPEQDQGLVVAYLKEDGTAWYRQFIWDVNLQDYQWQYAEQIGTDTWDYINVSRLNDYRLSFQLSNLAQNLWLYTDRTWVGQATPPEFFSLYSNYIDKSAIYSPASFVRNVQIDSYSTTSVYDEAMDKYIWTVLFHFSKPVFKRGIEDTMQYVTLTGDLIANVQYISFNEEENAIEVTLWMLEDIEDVSIVSGDFTIASSDGIFVAEYPYGYANIDTLTKHWEINNAKSYDETYADTLVLGTDTTLNTLGYQVKTYKKLDQPNEAFTLGTGSGALVVGNVARQNIEIKTETFMLGADSTLNEILYSGIHVKPV